VEVARLPDASTILRAGLRLYTTKLRLKKNAPGFRLGIPAQVERLSTDLDDILCILMQAVLEHNGKDSVYLVTPDGPAGREVKVGLFNHTAIEVKEGLQVGDKGAQDPVALMSPAELREAFAVSKEARADGASPAPAQAGGSVRSQSEAAGPGVREATEYRPCGSPGTQVRQR
jgi:hypothetical protein